MGMSHLFLCAGLQHIRTSSPKLLPKLPPSHKTVPKATQSPPTEVV